MSEVANSAEAAFQAKINAIMESSHFDTDEGRKAASQLLNDELTIINKMNVSRDLVAHVYLGEDKNPKVDIFCRNERVDQLRMKIEYLSNDVVKNKDEIAKAKAYMEEISRINKFQ